MSDFNVQIKVRNGRLLRLIRRDFDSVAAFCRSIDLSPQKINGLVTMTQKPMRNSGEWTEMARNVSAALGVYPEEIWPDHMRKLKAKRATSEIEMDMEQVAAISDQSANVEKRLLLGHLTSVLSEREARVIAARMDGAELVDLADEEGVSRPRIYQIEMRAMEKMRKRAKALGVRSYGDAE